MKMSDESGLLISATGHCVPTGTSEGRYRSWAARMADRATIERDASEAERLMSIVAYWERLANVEDWQGDGASFAR
jgi:hypothetical protein